MLQLTREMCGNIFKSIFRKCCHTLATHLRTLSKLLYLSLKNVFEISLIVFHYLFIAQKMTTSNGDPGVSEIQVLASNSNGRTNNKLLQNAVAIFEV